MAKGTVQTGMDTTKTVLTGTKDAVSAGLTGAMGVAKGAVQTGMDTTNTVLTGTKDAVSTGLTGAVTVATGAVQTGLNTTPNVSAGTRNTISSGMAGAVNVANAAAQWGLDTSKAVLTGTKDAMSTGLTRVGNVARGGVQTGLGTIQNWLPVSQDAASGGLATSGAPDEGEQTILNPHEAQSCGVSRPPDTLCARLDLAGKATTNTKGLVSAEVTFTPEAALGKKDDVGPGATTCGQEGARGFATLRDALEELGEIFQPMSAEEQAQLAASQPRLREATADQSSYFVRLGDLDPSFRQRAFEHALSHLQQGQFQALDVLAQLEDAFWLIEKAQQAPDWQPGAYQGAGAPAPPLQPRSPPSFRPQVPAAGALSRVCSLVQQLHVAYSSLASGLQGLPAELRWQLRQARHSLCELHSVVSSAASVAELPAERLAQSRQGVRQAWQGLEQLLESVQHSPPLSWLVGPFALHPNGQQL
ncbi:perilipin-4 [Delphinapterus leucas]|uniref:Perilipin-4 n=1 Tax=Delphinapterus leucas TaxID=9749 RepID=A0A2Y9LTZ7_DELLE|nr:perilipin-4 [Delphinapterus leucas]